MIRPLAALAFLALGLGAATAQEAVPAQPAPADIVVDPAAKLDTTPKQANLLTGLYATKAVIEICAVTIDPKIAAGLDMDQKRLETSLGLDAASATEAYAKVKADVERTTPDCAEGSPDRASVDAVTAIYAAQAAAPATPGTEAPAAPAPAATPPAAETPATPAQ